MILNQIRKGLIVSCQASKGEPLNNPEIIAAMAKSAENGGAKAIRASGYNDIKAIKNIVSIPIIGIEKNYEYNSKIYITPTMKEVENIYKAGADIIAIDATKRLRPGNITTEDFIKAIKQNYNIPIMADISTTDEAVEASKLGVDLVATTLSGYTDYTNNRKLPDFNLAKKILDNISTPVVLEGGVKNPEEVKKAFEIGVFAVVVGTAITRPHILTSWFANAIKE